MVEQLLKDVGLQVGGGAGIGFVTGLLSKKVTKIIALLVAGLLAFGKWLEAKGVITVDWAAVTGGLVSAGSSAAKAAPSVFDRVVTTLGLGAGFTGGFLLGFKRG
ncbi:MAG: FUN14 domain-containing protein [Candidatus Nanohaloarchaea archaeon]